MSGTSPRGGAGASWTVRRVATGLNTGVGLALAAVLVLMVNYLSYRHYARADWSRSKPYALSEKTLGLLQGLTNEVRIIMVFQAGHDLYEDADNLLKEYARASRRIRVARVDPDRDLARTEQMRRQYGVDRANVVVFDAAGRTKIVGAEELAEYDDTPLLFGRPREKTAFQGEQAFSSAILGITQQKRPVVYFVTGHGERDIEDYSRSGGFSAMAQELRGDDIELRTLAFPREKSVPADADAVVIAGPDKPFSEAEREALRRYLEQKGRLLVMLDAATRTGLEGLLESWGVLVPQEVVLDATRSMTGRELFITAYDPHPITTGLKNMLSVFYLPRPVLPATSPEEAAGAADRPRVFRLASCSDAGWAETDMNQSPMKYDPESDRPGPVPVAVAVEKGAVPGTGVEIRPTRLVVFGDSDFAANGALAGANADFVLAAMNWLLDREALMAIAPKPIETQRLILTGRQLNALFWYLMAAQPGLVAAVGVVVWIRRRS